MTGAARLAGRPFGRTGLYVTPLALAANAVRGSQRPGPVLTPEDVEMAFHECGVKTFFVTARMKPLVEGLRRLILGGHREEITIISAAGLPTGGGVRRSWEKNMQALGTDVIDVFLLGGVGYRWYTGGRTWPAMLRLKDEGKVRAVGFSSHDRPLAAALGRELAVDVLMIRYNAAHRGAEREVFPTLGPERPAVLSYTATRWGALLAPLPDLGFPRAMTAGECYRFALSDPAVDCVLCGARSADEIREDVREVAGEPLTGEQLAEFRRFGDAVHGAARGSNRWWFR